MSPRKPPTWGPTGATFNPPRRQRKYEPPAIVIELVTLLTDNAIVRHSNDDETFLECMVCGEWDGHADDCPMPALERWLKS